MAKHKNDQTAGLPVSGSRPGSERDIARPPNFNQSTTPAEFSREDWSDDPARWLEMRQQIKSIQWTSHKPQTCQQPGKPALSTAPKNIYVRYLSINSLAVTVTIKLYKFIKYNCNQTVPRWSTEKATKRYTSLSRANKFFEHSLIHSKWPSNTHVIQKVGQLNQH